MDISNGYNLFEIHTYFDLYIYKKYCEWPILNIEIFNMFHEMGYLLYVVEREDFMMIEKINMKGNTFDSYGLSLLFILMKDGKFESVYSRWNTDDICERYLSILQLRILLEEKFITLIDKDGFRIKPHSVVTGLKGDMKLFKSFGEHEPVILYEFKDKRVFMAISDNPDFLDHNFSRLIPRPISNKLKRWVVFNKEKLLKYWNREIDNFFGIHRLQPL